MDNLKKRIDPWFILLIGAIVLWMLLALNEVTPASEIRALAGSDNPSVWVTALSSDNRTVRQYARDNILDSLPTESLIEIAPQACESTDPSTCLAGLWILAHTEMDGRGAIASGFLDSDSSDIRKAALDILAVDPVPETRARVIELTSDADTGVQASGLNALSAIGNPDDLPTFYLQLGHSTSVVRQAAHDGITSMAPGNPDVIPDMLGLAMGSDLAAAREALSILGELGGQDALDGLFELLVTGPVALAPDIANAIGTIGGDEASNRALDLFINGTGRVRSQMARVLGVMEVGEASEYLWEVVTDNSQEFWLRHRSIESLGLCGDEYYVPGIIQFIADPVLDPRLVRIGVVALGGLGGDEVIETYDQIIAGELDFGLNRSGGETALLDVVRGLGNMDSDESRARLRSILENTEPDAFDILIEVLKSITKVGNRADIIIIEELIEGKPVLESFANEAIRVINERHPLDRS